MAKLERANMSAEERQAHDEADAAIEAAQNKYLEAKQMGNMRMFLEWVNDTYVPAAKKKAVPEQEEGKKGEVKFVRWIVANISKHIHQDKFPTATKAK